MAAVANDGARMTMARAATTPATARVVSVSAARKALKRDGWARLIFGVRRKALCKGNNPRMHARATTQLNANQTCNAAIASLQVEDVVSFIAQTARSRP